MNPGRPFGRKSHNARCFSRVAKRRRRRPPRAFSFLLSFFTSDSDTMQAKGPNLVLTLFAAIFLIDLVHSQKGKNRWKLFQNIFVTKCIFLLQDLPPLECYVCGKAPHKSCDEFDPHDITFRQKCLDQKHQSCVKSFGAFQNVTGL